METEEDEHPHFYRPIMAGLLAGIVATLLNMIYDVVIRESTSFTPSELINVSSIIFITILLLVIAGAIFALFDRYLKHPVLPYVILFALLSILSLRFALHVQRTDNPALNHDFQALFSGIVIISGALATFLVPYLAKYEKRII